jgi:hypothetical protein
VDQNDFNEMHDALPYVLTMSLPTHFPWTDGPYSIAHDCLTCTGVQCYRQRLRNAQLIHMTTDRCCLYVETLFVDDKALRRNLRQGHNVNEEEPSTFSTWRIRITLCSDWIPQRGRLRQELSDSACSAVSRVVCIHCLVRG